MENDNKDYQQSGDDKKDGASEKGPRKSFGRRKVCPFILDKTLVLDYKNQRIVQRFISETGKIVPRHISGVSAKSQRKLTKHIKRARNIGFTSAAIE
ncbi:MAG: 30S ribosomal protein S18 [Proteobacteria bacterium]|jgi:small subunit ribosomal protein S18|nr:30S ribosomal protein S18 [Pseudomonadota bacterium]